MYQGLNKEQPWKVQKRSYSLFCLKCLSPLGTSGAFLEPPRYALVTQAATTPLETLT